MEPVRRIPMASSETDPVLAALIARLPPSGSVWPTKKRAAWMQMVWLSFDLVYEGDGEAIDLPSFLQAAAAPAPAVAVTKDPEPKKPAPSPFAFFIDLQGFARRGDGTRLMPADVGGILYDQRGEGDLGSIIWADDSAGVRGYQLDISPAF